MADDPTTTALARQQTGLAPGTTTALAPGGPEPPVRRAIQAMLQGSVEAFGDVVDALICDLDNTTEGLEQVAWLGSTRSVLEKERAWQSALGQLQWWDQFLATLPSPELLSERRRDELRRHKALRARARLQARDDALAAHREAIEDELADPNLSMEQREVLVRMHQDPEPGEWRVDLAAWEAQALSELPAAPDLVPILPADLDAAHSFAGFNAVAAMRGHPELGPRAAHMDKVIAACLRQELDISQQAAMGNAQIMTGIFWIALRRALGVGSHQLASAIQLLATSDHGPVQEQFTRELLVSWMAVLQDLPLKDQKRLGGGWRGLLGGNKPKALAADAPKQLTADEGPGVWGRLRKGLGLKE